MIDGPVTQDILKYKAKMIANFTIREAVSIAFGFGVVFGTFMFFKDADIDFKIYVGSILATPCFLFGFLKPYGQPLEKYLLSFIEDNILAPSIRRKEVHFPEYEKMTKMKIINPKTKKEIKDVKKSKEYKSIK